MNNGLFIALEGGEGAGKSTIARLISERIEKENLKCMITREPGGVDVAEDIRSVIMNYELTPKAEALLFAAARTEHLHKKVIPSLNDNTIVISDRYIDSSVIYQGFAKGLGKQQIQELNAWATDDLMPALSIYIDVDPVIGLERVNSGNREVNRFDQNDIEFHQAIRAGYNELFTGRDHSYIIDGEQTIEMVVEQVYNLIKEYLG